MTKFNPEPYGSNNVRLDRYHVSNEPGAPLDNVIHVTLTYPPSDGDLDGGRIRYILVNQESVRASDGIRLHYDYDRDGFVIEQCRNHFTQGQKENQLDSVDVWTEVGFFGSWALEDPDGTRDLDAKIREATEGPKE